MPIISMTNVDIVKWLAWGPCNINEIHGYNNNASTIYIQFFQFPATPATGIPAGSIPVVKSLQVVANLPFSFTLPLEFSECTMGLSSTEANYTALGANGGLDWSLNLTTMFDVTNAAILGDMSTSQNALQVWPEVNGPQRLCRVEVKNVNGASGLYLNIFSADTIAPPRKPISSIPIPGGTAVIYSFGFGNSPASSGTGFSPIQADPTLATTTRAGCTVQIGPANSAGLDGVNTWNIRAIKKTL